ncbi:class I SAM-dependent methyltransferase [Parendozoicomonas haliclonae]|uniref:Ribosomal RNA large subunit methyltransferase K n=1 Tax=Parendozoicomonas haliclonae TaxID=1960125 RepID=A0A1X7AIX6_9GAMM|nr:class I SAM-dependent methyltransferase [Parendozoicomonas haliclonae]SMA45183.1 Ribosomal RNA large subunit methyltransferase K [Parendozoicomonas haliclonae]
MSAIELLAERLRTTTLGDAVCRLFHGRGRVLEGFEQITLDWYPPVLLLTAFKPVDQELKGELEQMLQMLWTGHWQRQDEMNLVFQQRGAGIASVDVLSGSVPEHHIVEENGRKSLVHLMRGQNHGLFLDMRNGRDWVQENASGKNVLNLFSYTCAFSVAALEGGAEQVINIDMSKGALAIGRDNHKINGLNDKYRLLGHDIFKSWGKLRKLGPYDLIIADPPSNQKGSFVATKDYPRLLRKLPELLNTNGEVLLCLNAPELPGDFLKEQVREECPELLFVRQIENPAVFMDVDPDRALKVFLYRKPF